jgi:hypothetical protein
MSKGKQGVIPVKAGVYISSFPIMDKGYIFTPANGI